MMINLWTCQTCRRNNAPGKKRCRCGAEQPTAYDMGGHVVEKKPEDTDEQKKEWAKVQRKIQRDVKPGTEEQLFTSTRTWNK